MTRSKKLSVNNDSVVAFMPIKPIYAEKLIKGEKKYEFRKTAIRSDLSHIIIYATSPVKKIIGIAEIKGIQEYKKILINEAVTGKIKVTA